MMTRKVFEDDAPHLMLLTIRQKKINTFINQLQNCIYKTT